jgi:outer membrane lipoprotein-sorting protein
MNATILSGLSPARALLRAACRLALFAALALPAPLALAEDVPLPRLRPEGAVPVLPAARTATNPASGAIAAPPPGFQPDPRLPFTPAQQAALASINAYFNSFRLMEGEFIQISPDGRQADGVFFISRPGRVRFHYNPPSQLDITANNGTVAVRDRKLRTQDLYPLSKTPLRYLLADKINLLDPGLVSSVEMDDNQVSVVIAEQSNVVSGKIRMTFDRRTSELLRWVVTDAQGDTSFGVFNTTTGKPQDPGLYFIRVN